MKFVVAFAAVLALALAAPVDEKDAQVLKFVNDASADGGYAYQIETSNGIQAQETGEVKSFPEDVVAVVVKGSYSYTGPDGEVYTVNYIADENGFQPEAAHLPRA
ncbi:cuticle protein CP14.6-like [Toxorhynchites rutilus septentrionalis]|uniref:cuticle protein CP14.6-like n=1 Tax=Toxorhynchites rutilus septentrionalis TaxID=329112 RepID=UPI00247A68D3|nr:cuticle protein CP14.6-like [Toxorhynchites rutilus septentrionalis]